jgi:pilus assembly protein CpaB
MNVKTWLPLCLSLVVGGIVCKFAYDRMNSQKAEAPVSKTAQVVVATRGIGAGEMLSDENCELKPVVAESMPESSFHSVAELKGRVAQVQFVKNQPIVETLLAPNGAGAGLQAIIPLGMRAISIEINEFSGVGGMLLPGCHVDVIATVPGESGGEMVSRTIVQNVEITAVGQRIAQQPRKEGEEPTVFRSVTILATPNEAEAIELAASSGRPRLVLRSGSDKSLAQTQGVTVSNLRGQSIPKIEPRMFVAAAPTTSPTITPVEPVKVVVYPTVKVIRGCVESEVRLDAPIEQRSVVHTDMKPVSNMDTKDAH